MYSRFRLPFIYLFISAPMETDDPFVNFIGTRREHKNILLVRKAVGQQRPTTYDLPGPEFVYGASNPVQQESAKDGEYEQHECFVNVQVECV